MAGGAEAIDPAQPIPIYLQLKTLLLEQILRGRYGPGERLPTEHELCARYGISRTPVHRALAEMADDGVVLRHRRRGTFVNPHFLSLPDHRRPEVRVLVPEGPWEDLVAAAAPEGSVLNVATVELHDLRQVLVHAVAEGRAPDLALLDSVWVPEFAAAGFLRPLAELDERWVAEEFHGDFLEPFVTANRHGGEPVAVQAEADVAGLWFRRDVLTAAGLAPPGTWAELNDVCAELRARGHRHPLALPGGSRAGETTTYCLLALLAANGVTVLSPDAVTLGGAASVECLAFLRQLLDAGVISADVVAYDHDRAPRQLATGQAALSMGGSYEVRTIAAETGAGIDEVWRRFGFLPAPRGPRTGAAPMAGGMVYGIFRQATQPHHAMRLLQRVVSTDALARMSRSTGQLAARRSAAVLAARGSPFLTATAPLLHGAVVRPATPQYARVSAQLQTMLEAVLVGRLEPQAAVERAAEMIGAIVGLPVTA